MKNFKCFVKERQLWLLALLLMPVLGFSQQKPLEFSKVTEEELKMQVYDKDTSAAAVVLYDYGESSFAFTKGEQIIFKRNVRIKILNKAGLDWANVVIPFYQKDFSSKEEVLDLKATTYNLENGVITKVKLDPKTALFEEKQDARWYQKKFTMPSVKPGSIIEFSYTIKSDFLFNLRSWEFQYSIPVVWSEYRVSMAPFYSYKQIMHGNLPFHVKDAKVFKQTAAIVVNQETGSYGTKTEERGIINMNVVQYQWVMKDVPAFSEEPYMTSAEDYRSKLEFELSSIQYSEDSKPVYTSGDWETFTKELQKDETFGKQLESPMYLNKVAQALITAKPDQVERAKAAFEMIKKQVRWDGKHRVYSESLKKAYDKGTGSVADVNLLLTALLREAGVEAYPMLISTREHGRPVTQSPMLSKFDYVITYATINGKDYLLDATESDLPMGMLPFRCLNEQGWVMQGPKGKWMPLKNPDKSVQTVTATMTIKPTGEVTGKVQELVNGVPALQLRSKIRTQGEETYLKNYAVMMEGVERNQVKLLNLDNLQEPMKTDYLITRKGSDQAESLLYLSPLMMHAETESPFKLATRQFPVDFASPVEETYVYTYDLPVGYEVEEMPKSSALTLPGNSARFMYQVQVINGKLQIISKLNINKTVFAPDEYGNLREFYNQMIAKHAEKVVLRKKS